MSLDNESYQLLVGISEDIHRLTEHFAPAVNQDNSMNAAIGGAIFGAANSLEFVLDSGRSLAIQRLDLRNLILRWRAIADDYFKKQAEIDQERAANVAKSKTD